MFADVLISKRRKLVLGVIIATKQEKKTYTHSLSEFVSSRQINLIQTPLIGELQIQARFLNC